jgi:hypothetical protein
MYRRKKKFKSEFKVIFQILHILFGYFKSDINFS